MVDRFDPPRDLDCKPLPMRPDIDGQYVRYSDLVAARAEIERLTKERDEARAQVAAAYGSAADALQNAAENWDCGHNESRLCDCARDAEQWGFAADEARSMTPDDAKSALEAYGREKVREGMMRAVDLYPQGIAAILADMETLK